MMRREHLHSCCNKALGCKAEFTCRAEPEVDEDGKHCPYDNDVFECEDCETSRCAECGAFLNLEAHDRDCEAVAQATAESEGMIRR